MIEFCQFVSKQKLRTRFFFHDFFFFWRESRFIFILFSMQIDKKNENRANEVGKMRFEKNENREDYYVYRLRDQISDTRGVCVEISKYLRNQIECLRSSFLAKMPLTRLILIEADWARRGLGN